MNNTIKMGYILIKIESGYAENMSKRRKITQPEEVMTVFSNKESLKAMEEQGKEYKELVLIALRNTIDRIKKGY